MTRTEDVSGSGKYGDYAGVITLFDKLDEYRDALKNQGSTDINGDVMKAINDFERRKQLGNLRPGPAKTTGVRRYTSAISNALKAGQVDEADLMAALEAAGVSIPAVAETTNGGDEEVEEEEEEED